MIRAIGVFILMVLILLLAVPVAVHADEWDIYPPEVPPPALYVNGDPVEPDEYGNYELLNGEYCEISADSGLAGNITLYGESLWSFSSDLDISGHLTVLGGALVTNDYSISCNGFYAGHYRDATPISINLGSSKINCFSFAVRGSGVKLDAGTSLITTTLLFDDTDRTGRVYHDVTIKSDNKIYGFVEGNSKFNDLKFENDVSMYLKNSVEAVTLESAKGTITTADSTIKLISKESLEAAKIKIEPIGEVTK